MGRRHLSRLLVGIALVLAAAAPASAASTLTWRVVAHGIASSEPTSNAYGRLATTRAAARALVTAVPADARTKALALNFRTSVLVGVFGPFGCTDGRVHVTRIDESGQTLLVHLTISPLPPGTMECQAIFPTFRLLVLPRAALPTVPSRVSVSVATA